MDPKPNQLICDLTAAPGSKTTQLAALMENTGTIVANDISRTRIYKLLANLASAGVTNTQTLTFPGQALWKKYPNFFDSVLVDAPCTMEGRFSTKDPQSFADWKPKKVKLLSKLQKYLLWSAFSATKPGGTIIYSTCTLEPEENEVVVDWLLQKEKGHVTIEPIDLEIEDTQAGLTTWKKKTFASEMTETLRILPSQSMEGFYIAQLRKQG
jgi:16S rRNA (cytosine1407-C5)-methyltransferase